MSNQIDHFTFSSRFSRYLLDMRNNRGAEINLESEHYLIVASVDRLLTVLDTVFMSLESHLANFV